MVIHITWHSHLSNLITLPPITDLPPTFSRKVSTPRKRISRRRGSDASADNEGPSVERELSPDSRRKEEVQRDIEAALGKNKNPSRRRKNEDGDEVVRLVQF